MALVIAVLNLAKRVYEIVFAYFTMPIAMSTLPLDDGARFKNWRELFVSKLILAYGAVFAVNIFALVLPLINAVHLDGVNGFGNAMFTIFMIVGGAMLIPAGQTLFARLFGQADDMRAGGGWLRSAFYGGRIASAMTVGLAAKGIKAIASRKKGERKQQRRFGRRFRRCGRQIYGGQRREHGRRRRKHRGANARRRKQLRIIPKKIKVKNTVWKCYSMTDVIVALFVFALIFIAITAGNWALAIIMGLIAVVMFMPTPDGIFYTCIFENVKFLFAKKRYTACAKNSKENIDTLLGLKEIKTNGLLTYSGGMYGRVIKVGQKNFGIEDVVQQNIDIGYIANALKLLDANQSADIIKIDRPVNLDGFSEELFARLSALREEEPQTREIRRGILQERIDRIDKLSESSICPTIIS